MTGSVERKVQRPINKKIIPEKLAEYVEAHPDAYLKEIAEVFGCYPSSVLKRLRKLDITRKKNIFYKEHNLEKTAAYLEKVKDVPPRKACMCR